MSQPSIQDKTVRPGSFVGYSYYHHDSRPPPTISPARRHKRWQAPAYLIVLVGLIYGLSQLLGGSPSKPPSSQTSRAPLVAASGSNQACQSNSLTQLIKVSIGARHLWACNTDRLLYDAPVVTGISTHPDTITPTGTYLIFSKQTNTTLSGADSTGSWSDPVYYWLPFLTNQYGTYGLHDATWRPNSAFGQIDPSSAQASHGCVELPLAAAKWLYDWAQVGTTVQIKA